MSTDDPRDDVLDDEALGLFADIVATSPNDRLRPQLVRDLPTRSRQPASPADALADTIAEFDSLLQSLSADDWSESALRDLNVLGLVGHTIGVDRYLTNVALGGAGEALDHRGGTQAAIDEAVGLHDPTAVVATWRAASDALLTAVRSSPPEQLATHVAYFTLAGPLGAIIIARAFELWNHTDDIRRALNRPVAAPSASTLAAMTDLASVLVPMTVADAAEPGTAMRLVLTGPGGGTWVRPFDESSDPRETLTVVAPAVDFCRLIGDRIERAALDVELIGDTALGERVLVGARSLALD